MTIIQATFFRLFWIPFALLDCLDRLTITHIIAVHMSSSDDPPGWASSKLVPSVIFIITPIIAVGLLVIWSLRIQNIRRRYIAALARQAYAPSANRLDPRDIPVMHEVWIGDRWWDTGHDPALKASTAQAIPHMSSSKMEGHINGLYNWINIMPVYLASDAQSSGPYNLGTFIRMPSRTMHEDISHTAMSDLDMQLATILIPDPKPLN